MLNHRIRFMYTVRTSLYLVLILLYVAFSPGGISLYSVDTTLRSVVSEQ